MEFINCAHSRPDSGETRRCRYSRYGLYASDCVRGQPGARDEPDRSSEKDMSHIEELDIARLGRCPEFGERKDPLDELHVNIGLDMQKQKELHCVIGTCVAIPGIHVLKGYIGYYVPLVLRPQCVA